MSDVQNTVPAVEMPAEDVAASAPEVSEPTATTTESTEPHALSTDEPVAESTVPEVSPVEPATTTDAAAVNENSTEVAAAAAPETQAIEPVSEGPLGYKAPGLLNKLTFSTHEFWLQDEPITAQHMDHYMRGEKPEFAHPVVGWAGQTGKGLLFFNKKGLADKTHPQSVLPLYEASDLEQKAPHEFSFKIAGKRHTFKAANDLERDGWYQEIEKSMELGKASKETTRGSQGYKDSMKKLGTPNILAAGGAAATAAEAKKHSSARKSTDIDRAYGTQRAGSDEAAGEAEPGTKANKSRSRSRGFVDRLKQTVEKKKDEHDAKKDIKKEDKIEQKEDKKEDKLEKKEKKEDKLEKKEDKLEKKEDKLEKKELKQEEKADKKEEKKEAKEEKKAEKDGEIAVVGGAALDAPSTASRVIDAPVEETPVAEATPATAVDDAAVTRPAKSSKRNSVFGRMSSGFASFKSPTREKNQAEGGLGAPEVPPKDTGISDTPPVLPETTTDSSAIDAPAAEVPETTAETSAETAPETATETAPVETSTAAAPATEKKGGFLSGLPFMTKRNRSVSPSPAAATEAPAVPAKNDEPVAESTEAPKIEEPAAEVTPAAATTEEDPPTKTTSPTANKRNSIVGNFSSLGRRASSAFTGRNKVKKDSVSPAPVTENTEGSAIADDTPAADETVVPETEKAENSVVGDSATDAGLTNGHAETSTPVAAAA